MIARYIFPGTITVMALFMSNWNLFFFFLRALCIKNIERLSNLQRGKNRWPNRKTQLFSMQKDRVDPIAFFFFVQQLKEMNGFGNDHMNIHIKI